MSTQSDRVRRALGGKVQFVQGDDACAFGAILAGCTFFGGYPITPATEVAERMAAILPLIGGCYIQMEDEIASMGAIIGASWTGAKVMTATSGPGFSLMQENLGYAIMTETPCVVVNVQRSGPSTGQPTLGAYGDMMQARWGTHGDHEIIMLTPSNVQECLELTVVAFNLAEQYRTPALLFLDGELGHMRERLVIPDEGELEIVSRKRVEHPHDYRPFGADESLVPAFAPFGAGFRTYVTGLTHNEQGLPKASSAAIHDKLVRRLANKITLHVDEITRYEEFHTDDCELLIVAYGITARTCRDVVEEGRRRGLKVGLLRLITIWPFPDAVVARLAARARAILVPEMNLGQIVHPIREAVAGRCPVTLLSRIGGELHAPEELLTALEEQQCQLR